jgi:hypothetical protein
MVIALAVVFASLFVLSLAPWSTEIDLRSTLTLRRGETSISDQSIKPIILYISTIDKCS